MRIRLWNAFASNNSGSYTIVGTFHDAATAKAVAAELQSLCDAECEWQRRQWNPASRGGPRPVASLARQLDPDAKDLPGPDADDDQWPDLSFAEPPRVTHTSHQVVLHAPYTVTMPRMLGQLLYQRGGRVDVELDHAHELVVVDHQFWAEWNDPDRERRLNGALAALLEPGSPLRQHAEAEVEPVVRLEEKAGPMVRALAVYSDLVGGVAAMTQLAAAHGLQLQIRLLEAEPGDPLRPWR